jgi:hypothetical protein
MKKSIVFLSVICIMVCLTGCNYKNDERKDDFIKAFQDLELPYGCSYDTVRSLIKAFDEFEGLHDGKIIAYTIMSPKKLKKIEDKSDFIYDEDKCYCEVAFGFALGITRTDDDLCENGGEYIMVVSMDEKGTITPEIVTFSGTQGISRYETDADSILRGLNDYAEVAHAMVSRYPRYSKK